MLVCRHVSSTILARKLARLSGAGLQSTHCSLQLLQRKPCAQLRDGDESAGLRQIQ